MRCRVEYSLNIFLVFSIWSWVPQAFVLSLFRNLTSNESPSRSNLHAQTFSFWWFHTFPCVRLNAGWKHEAWNLKISSSWLFYCPTFPHVTTSRQGRFEGNEGSVRSESHATPITACGEISELCVNKIDSRLTSIMSWREKNLGKLKWKQSSCAVSWFPRHLSPSDPSLPLSVSHYYYTFVRPRKFRSGIGEEKSRCSVPILHLND